MSDESNNALDLLGGTDAQALEPKALDERFVPPNANGLMHLANRSCG